MAREPMPPDQSPKTPVDVERREWKPVKLARSLKSDRLRIAPLTPAPGYEAMTALLTETYVPESAPNVLSEAEARDLAEFADWAFDNHVGLTAEQRLLFDRLKDWATHQGRGAADE